VNEGPFCYVDVVNMAKINFFRARNTVLLAALFIVATLSPSGATTKIIPGTAKQVATEVAASAKVIKLTKQQVAQLSAASSDAFANLAAGTQCRHITTCHFGSRSPKSTAVILGDSHAMAWMPALLPGLLAHGYGVSLLAMGACTPATLEITIELYHYPRLCDAFRTSALAEIAVAHPSLVVVAEKINLGGSGAPLSPEQWQQGLETTLSQLKAMKTKVALIEDVPKFPVYLPSCLAQHPTTVQQCQMSASAVPDPLFRAAERQAAVATSVSFIATRQWFCATTCSPMIASHVVLYDSQHLSKSYATYLSTVMTGALQPLFTK
jgi:hypothetical protein